MSLKLTQDTSMDYKLTKNSSGVNKKLLVSADKKTSEDSNNVNLHNTINSKFVKNVKNKKKMSTEYFKATLSCVYSDVYKKKIIWADLKFDTDLQSNIKAIKSDISYIKIYEILDYYSKDAEKIILSSTQLIDLTAIFFSSLYFFIERNLEIE